MPGDKPQPIYRRSWRNYLLDDRYQLNFTFLLVIVCTVVAMIVGLGVKREVMKATTIAVSDVQARVDEGLIEPDKAQASIDRLVSRRRLISYLLVAMDFGLMVGLFIYGIRMTHRVAGPLHKVALYLDKVRGGRFDTVYPLRKGDQVTEFYDHFREAHEGLRKAQEVDVEALRKVIAAAEQAELGNRSSAVAQGLVEMKAILKSKEASLV
jgi:nitrogen fixation/metabolism regulation signal transduction histidine kinase